MLEIEEFKKLNNLPSFPQQIVKVLDRLGHTSSLDYNILKLIQFDPTMAARILHMANLPLYGYGARVDSVQQASGLLGPSVIKSIILTTPILERFGVNGNYHSNDLDFPKIWIHSMATGIIAGGLAERWDPLNANFLCTAGLLFDIGKIALAVQYPKEMQAISKARKKKKIRLIHAEIKTLGLSHSEVAREMARAWNFPKNMVGVLGSDPLAEDLKEKVIRQLARTVTLQSPFLLPAIEKNSAVVGLAKILASSWGYEDDLEGPLPMQYDALLDSLEKTQEDINEMAEDLRKFVAFQIDESFPGESGS